MKIVDSGPLEGLKYFILKEIVLEVPNAKHRSKLKLRLDLKDHRLSGGQEPSLYKTDIEVQANAGARSVVIPATDRWPRIKSFRIEDSAACTVQLTVEQKEKLGIVSLPGSQSTTFKVSGEVAHKQSKHFGEGESQHECELSPETPDLSMRAKLRFELNTRDFERLMLALNGAAKDLIERKSILDQLGQGGKMFETAIELAKPVSELSTVAKVILGGMGVIYKRLKDQQKLSESIKDRLDEIQLLMKTISEGSPRILSCANLHQVMKELLTHALNVVSFIEGHAKKGGIGNSGCPISYHVYGSVISHQSYWS